MYMYPLSSFPRFPKIAPESRSLVILYLEVAISGWEGSTEMKTSEIS